MDSAHHIWCPLCCQKIESLPDGAEMTPTIGELGVDDKPEKDEGITTVIAILVKGKREYLYRSQGTVGGTVYSAGTGFLLNTGQILRNITTASIISNLSSWARRSFQCFIQIALRVLVFFLLQ